MTRTFSARVDIISNGVKKGELSFRRSNPPDVLADRKAALKVSIAGDFIPTDSADFMADELRPAVIINGREWHLGVFTVCSVRDTQDSDGRMWHIEAYDRCYRVQSRRTESRLHFAAGTGYMATIESLLTACGISLVIKTATAAVLATEREDWEVGTDYLTIVNTLLSEINYGELWFDGDGYARLHPEATPSADKIDHTYNGDDPTVLMRVRMDVESDAYARPNVVVCVCDNPDMAEPMTATAKNEAPQSRLSILRRGMRITKVVKVDNIASQSELEVYAQRLINDYMSSGEVVTLRTGAEGGHGIGDTVAVNRAGAQGLYRETGWSMSLNAGAYMTHTLEKVVYV